MSLHRRNPKRDANEKMIVQALRQAGVCVWHISGEGVPDLLTYRRGIWLPLEVKRQRARKSLTDRKGKSLTPAQCETYALTHFPIVETVSEALQAVGIPPSPDHREAEGC